jgi:hypothetical protein
MGHTDFNTEGTDAKYGVKLELRNGNTTTYWYATKAKQKAEIKKWKPQTGGNQFYKSVKAVTR